MKWWMIPLVLMFLGNTILSLICLCVLCGAAVVALFMGMAKHNI